MELKSLNVHVFVPKPQRSGVFNWVSPVQGFKPVKVGGLSEENSAGIGNKNEKPFPYQFINLACPG